MNLKFQPTKKIKLPDGSTACIWEGKLHNTDGPALVYENGKKESEIIIYMGGVVEKNSPFELIQITFVNELINFNQFRDRKSLDNLCKEVTDEGQILKYCEFENLKTKKKEFEIIKSKWNITNRYSKKYERISYFVPHTNGVIFYHVYCNMSCKKIEENFPSIISSVK